MNDNLEINEWKLILHTYRVMDLSEGKRYAQTLGMQNSPNAVFTGGSAN